ncbi:hypothetical protein EDB87DRAFT_1640918, partial [Lactarius vividus]
CTVFDCFSCCLAFGCTYPFCSSTSHRPPHLFVSCPFFFSMCTPNEVTHSASRVPYCCTTYTSLPHVIMTNEQQSKRTTAKSGRSAVSTSQIYPILPVPVLHCVCMQGQHVDRRKVFHSTGVFVYVKCLVCDTCKKNGIPKGTKKKTKKPGVTTCPCQSTLPTSQARKKSKPLPFFLPSEQIARRKCKWKFPGGEKKKATRATQVVKEKQTSLSFIPVWAMRSHVGTTADGRH